MRAGRPEPHTLQLHQHSLWGCGGALQACLSHVGRAAWSTEPVASGKAGGPTVQHPPSAQPCSRLAPYSALKTGNSEGGR